MSDEFLLAPDVAFLNHGSFSAIPREVFEVPNTRHDDQTIVRMSVQGHHTEDDPQRLLDAPAPA